MIQIASLNKASRFYVLTRLGSGHLHARECHFDKFNAKAGTCRVSDYGFKRIKLSFDCTIDYIAGKAFSSMAEANKTISQLAKGRE
jgi:hypothetical protein